MLSSPPGHIHLSGPRTAWPLIVGTVLSGLAVAVALAALRTPMIDLAVYRAGARAVLDGKPLYPGAVWHGLNFVYPPIAAIAFIPFALLPTIVAEILAGAANLALLAFVCRTSLIMLGEVPGRRLTSLVLLACGVLFWLDAVRTTVYLGQVNLALLAMVLWDMSRPDGRRTKGVMIGIAAGIKLTPLIFVVFLLCTRRFRAAAIAGATFAGTILVGFLVLPGATGAFWFGGRFADATRILPDLASPHNQSLFGLLARAGATSLWPWFAVAVAAGALVLAVRAARRGEHLLAVTLCGLASPTVSPYSWDHHWVFLVPLALFIAYRLATEPRHLYWLVPAVPLLCTVPWIANLANPPAGPPRITGGPMAFLLGNPCVLIYVLVLGCTAWYLRPSPDPLVTNSPAGPFAPARWTRPRRPRPGPRAS
ncbi:MAG TPA: glycosyltransferase 87 family protein [Pseudonocardiaceae bacterium]|nr:glycosyltransferase 87 family protein [Pseudonocardiaceae bacterium]